MFISVATPADASPIKHDPIATAEQPTRLTCRHPHTTAVTADNTGQFLQYIVYSSFKNHPKIKSMLQVGRGAKLYIIVLSYILVDMCVLSDMYNSVCWICTGL